MSRTRSNYTPADQQARATSQHNEQILENDRQLDTMLSEASGLRRGSITIEAAWLHLLHSHWKHRASPL